MRRLFILVGLVIGFALASNTRAEGAIEVALADGRIIHVAKSGPLHDPEAVALARSIKKTDRKIERLRESVDDRVSSGRLDRDVGDATLETLVELRELSAKQLDLAIRKAKNTSGFLDKSLIRTGQGYVNGLLDLLRANTSRMTVATRVRTDPPGRVLHYMLMSDYDDKSQRWQSYSEEQLMHIGNYMFQASSDGKNGTVEVFEELVPVLADPTVHTIKVR